LVNGLGTVGMKWEVDRKPPKPSPPRSIHRIDKDPMNEIKENFL